MYTSPSIAEVIDGVIASLNRDVMPELQSQKAAVAVIMMQTLLEGVKQRVPIEQQMMAAEHNQMTAVYREMAQSIGSATGPEAERIRARAATLGAYPDLPQIPAFDDLARAYRELSQGLVDSLDDLDRLIRAGNAGAEAALEQMRTYLGPRTIADFTTYFVGAGMAGRG
ncbi:MAG: hypothetical protein LC118_00235 [Dehalococcoidia bacterium]|nr:hypothetical protein [Dehalococcoidia bacterium]